MKLEGHLPVPSLSATLFESASKLLAVQVTRGQRSRRKLGARSCTACGGDGHQRNSSKCPARAP